MMKRLISILALCVMVVIVSPVWADEYQDTMNIFKKAVESGSFFQSAHGYAVFPNIAKAGVGVGGAGGKGRVYEKGKYVGDTSMTQVTVGLQIGGQAYSQIVFFEDQRAFREFTSGKFEFGAEVSAVAITVAAGAKAGTAGTSVGAKGGPQDAKTTGTYKNGMAIFTVAKGGFMYEASIGGQKFSYKAR